MTRRVPAKDPALPAITARELAYDVLSRATTPSLFVARLLDQRLGELQIAPDERRLATELVHGVVRRRATLDAVLRPFVQRRPGNIEPGLKTLLHLGAYQLVLLTGIPAHAAVNETAELARRIGQPRWTGFINGVLRALSRALSGEITDAASAYSVPLAGGQFRRLATEAAVFPDPRTQAAEYFALAFSFPRWLAARWASRFESDELHRLGFWFNATPPVCLRINPLRTTLDDFLPALEAAGVRARPGLFAGSVWLERSGRIPDLPGYAAGWFVVQDESAMSAAALLAPQPGERVLDLCAAPGGKTAHLATLMNNQGSVLATDIDAERLALVDETCGRLGLEIVTTHRIERDGAGLPDGPFDAILLDVPCSNTGVLGRRTEARWRLQAHDVAELSALQTRLLRQAVERLSPAGRVVYSTCSIEPEENRAVVDAVLRDTPALRLVRQIVNHPGQPADGGYQALLEQAKPAKMS